MVSSKKKLAFYSVLASGHLNVCAALGKVLLDNHSDRVEVYFVVDKQWADKLSKIDSRFKFGCFDYDDKKNDIRILNIVEKLERTLSMSLIDRQIETWNLFARDPTLIEVDRKSEEKLREIKPDYVLCDQLVHLPAMVNTSIPYGFVISSNPLVIDLDGFPQIGSDCGVDEKERIKKFDEQFLDCRDGVREHLHDLFEKRGTKFYKENVQIDQILSDHLSVYCYPREIDYFDDKIREKFNLYQIDSPLITKRIPKPYELPEDFKNISGKTIYISFGTLYSNFTDRLQNLVDILDKLPYKYIVSKGLYGDRLKFPSNKFIGENHVDQLAVLQVVDAMIAHGGNNTLCECFYFGIKCIIMPFVGDQINNAKRLEETSYGYSMDILDFNEQELESKLDKLLNDEKLDLKWKKASERIQRENSICKVVEHIANYLDRL